MPLVELGSVLEGKEQRSVTFENWLLVSERDLRAAAFKARCTEADRIVAKQPFAFFYDDAVPGDAGVVWKCAKTASMSLGKELVSRVERWRRSWRVQERPRAEQRPR